MKAILISIRPEWVKKILAGEKTIEIRKTKPKCDLPITVYIYCTKGKSRKNQINMPVDLEKHLRETGSWDCVNAPVGNERIIAKFTLNKIKDANGLLDLSSMSLSEFNQYVGSKKGYAWYIDDLLLFDKPLELKDFSKSCDYRYGRYCEKGRGLKDDCEFADAEICYHELTAPPQSWQYVEVME